MNARAASIGSASPPVRKLRPVTSRKRRNKSLIRRTAATKTLTLTVALGVVVSALVAAVLIEHALLAQSAFELQELRERAAEQEAYHEELLLEAAQLDSAARIERYARESLGMVDPAPANVRYIVADVGRKTLRRNSRDGTLARDMSPGDDAGLAAPADGTGP